MNRQIDKSMMKAYQQRWQSVVEFEAAEQRQASFTQRWHQLNSLMRMAAVLGLELTSDEEQDEIMRERWNTLRAMYIAETQKSK